MGGLMRGKLVNVKNTAKAVVFSLILPFSGGMAYALPGKPPQSAPASFPSSMKLKEPKLDENLSIVASLRSGNGSMIRAMLTPKNYKRLIILHQKMNRATDKELIREAPGSIARERRIFDEAMAFNRKERLNVAVASIFLNSRQLFLINQRDKKSIDLYLKKIETLGFAGISDTLRHWLKNSRGDSLSLYKSMRTRLAIER